MPVRRPVRRPAALRTLVVAALAAGLALVPGAAQAHGRNHAPDRPAALTTTPPGTACADGTTTPVRSLTPLLSATLVDRDGDQVRATFTLRDGSRGRLLWAPPATTPQASGTTATVQVPEGLLVDGRTYEWRVQAKDTQGRKSPTVRCRVVVDATAPGEPWVTAVEGGDAVYAEDATSGGVGQSGAFLLESADADVVAFQYGFDGGQDTVEVDAGTTSATVTWAPLTAGPSRLEVRAVDAAGNVGPTRLYRFTVGSGGTGDGLAARWSLDEGAGSVARASGAPTAIMTLSPSTTWTGGLQADAFGSTTDRGLLLVGAGDGAATAGRVLDTSASFTLGATVRVDGPATGTVLGQDGADGSVVALGTSTTGCPEDVVPCWVVDVVGADGAPVRATSTVPVQAGTWYSVFGVRDALSGALRVDVCVHGSAAQQFLDGQDVRAGAPVGLADAAPADGPFRVGGHPSGADAWQGVVGSARTWTGPLDEDQQFLLCSGRGV